MTWLIYAVMGKYMENYSQISTKYPLLINISALASVVTPVYFKDHLSLTKEAYTSHWPFKCNKLLILMKERSMWPSFSQPLAFSLWFCLITPYYSGHLLKVRDSSRHDWKIVDWDVKPQHKQTNQTKEKKGESKQPVNPFAFVNLKMLKNKLVFFLRYMIAQCWRVSGAREGAPGSSTSGTCSDGVTYNCRIR